MTAAPPANALPRMSLVAGSPCATCHVAAQGGGMRNSIGFGTSQHTGAVPWSKMGVKSFDTGSPSFGGDTVTVGADIRSVLARMGRPKGDKKGDAELPDFLYVPMQLQPYVGIKPVEWLDIVGSYNLATLQRAFPGQATWEAFAQVHGPAHLPTVRVGMIQPTFGIRHDDHSMLIRADATSPRRPVIPPNYAEIGGELGYQPISWLRVDAGGFMVDNLKQTAAAAVGSSKFAYSARVMVMPQIIFGGSGEGGPTDDGFDDDDDDDFGEDDDEEEDDGGSAGSINTWLGGSVFGAGDFQMINAFLGVGASNLGSLIVEGAMIQKGPNWTGVNMMAMLSVRAGFEWLYFNVRGEQATMTEVNTSGGAVTTQQFVVGFEVFPFAYLEVRPEYRILITDEYRMNHYTLQFHTAF